MLKKFLEYATGNTDEGSDQSTTTNSDVELTPNTAKTDSEESKTEDAAKDLNCIDEKSDCSCHHHKKCGPCTNRRISFKGTINTCVDILDIKGPPNLVGYNITDLKHKKTECKTLADIHVCDQTIKCPVSLDSITFDGSATLLLSVCTLLDLDCPSSKEVTLVTCAGIRIVQTCFACKDSEHCHIDKCNLLKLETINAKKTASREITITGSVTFVCP
ncbi:MAG: hypothetical protein AB6733_02160 [Clostridiaceae bacterium]